MPPRRRAIWHIEDGPERDKAIEELKLSLRLMEEFEAAQKAKEAERAALIAEWAASRSKLSSVKPAKLAKTSEPTNEPVKTVEIAVEDKGKNENESLNNTEAIESNI